MTNSTTQIIKVIFLDIDGVLNNADTFNNIDLKKTDASRVEIDEIKISLLAELVHSTGAKIVLTATLRGGWEKIGDTCIPCTDKAKKVDAVFKRYRIDVWDTTPYLDDMIPSNCVDRRCQEIDMWIWYISARYDIEAFVIFDDESSELMKYYWSNLIKTAYTSMDDKCDNISDVTGILPEHIARARTLLDVQAIKSRRHRSYEARKFR